MLTQDAVNTILPDAEWVQNSTFKDILNNFVQFFFLIIHHYPCLHFYFLNTAFIRSLINYFRSVFFLVVVFLFVFLIFTLFLSLSLSLPSYSLSSGQPWQVSVLQVWQHLFELWRTVEQHWLESEEENARRGDQTLLLWLGLCLLGFDLHHRTNLPTRQRRVLVWVCQWGAEQCGQHYHYWYE